MPPAPPPRTLRYLTAFRCLAGDCPDTCCAGMRIGLHPPDVEHLAATVPPAELGNHVVREPPQSAFFATLARDEHGACRWLRPDRLCALVARYGDGVLAEVCRVYPRTVLSDAGGPVVASTLGCPETARLALFSVDGMDLVAPAGPASGGIPVEDGRGRAADTLTVEAVRAALDPLVRAPEATVAERLLALALCASEAGGPGAAPGPAEWLRRAASLLAERSAAPDPVVAQVLFGALTSLGPGGPPRYGALMTGALGVFHQAARARDERFGQPGGPDLWHTLAATLGDRAHRLEAASGGELDRWLGRCLSNEWYRESHARSASLGAYVFKLALRVSLWRLAILGHPVVDAAVSRTAEGQPFGPADAVAAAVTEAVQVMSRRLDADSELMDVLEGRLTAQAMGTDEVGRVLAFA